MPPAQPDLDIVIVTYNNRNDVGGLLDSLPAALDGLTADVIVVDNGSTDGTADFVAPRKDCRLVRSANVGYAAGINRGVREAIPAEAILILNADVRLHAGSARLLFAALDEQYVGIVAPQIRSAQGKLDLSLRHEPSLLRTLGLTWTKAGIFSEYVARPEDYTSPRIVDWALGAVLMMSRKCFEELGGWDESYFLYSEETDFSLRARDVGMMTRYEPQAIAVHFEGQSGRNHITHTMRTINRVRLYRRRHGLLVSWCYYWLIVGNELSWLLRGRRESWSGVLALLVPSRRPPELGCSERLMPS
ncbi:MAG TPA: glycosyltransferase family 2 protein [Steroidobacteraceae bacterium]|jgi:GT2 family glycosyltransferase